MAEHRFHGVAAWNCQRHAICTCGWLGDGDGAPLDQWDDHRFLTQSGRADG